MLYKEIVNKRNDELYVLRVVENIISLQRDNTVDYVQCTVNKTYKYISHLILTFEETTGKVRCAFNSCTDYDDLDKFNYEDALLLKEQISNIMHTKRERFLAKVEAIPLSSVDREYFQKKE